MDRRLPPPPPAYEPEPGENIAVASDLRLATPSLLSEWASRLTSRKFDLTLGGILYLLIEQLKILPQNPHLSLLITILVIAFNVIEGVPDVVERYQTTKQPGIPIHGETLSVPWQAAHYEEHAY